MGDESMSSIWFCTTPKVDLPHYSYNFRKSDPLGEEIRDLDSSMIGTMLHLEIQKGKEAMNI